MTAIKGKGNFFDLYIPLVYMMFNFVSNMFAVFEYCNFGSINLLLASFFDLDYGQMTDYATRLTIAGIFKIPDLIKDLKT